MKPEKTTPDIIGIVKELQREQAELRKQYPEPSLEAWAAHRPLTVRVLGYLPAITERLLTLEEENEAMRMVLGENSRVHRGCDDGFYACPKSEDYFGRLESRPISERPCYCGVDDMQKVLKSLSPSVEHGN